MAAADGVRLGRLYLCLRVVLGTLLSGLGEFFDSSIRLCECFCEGLGLLLAGLGAPRMLIAVVHQLLDHNLPGPIRVTKLPFRLGELLLERSYLSTQVGARCTGAGGCC